VLLGLAVVSWAELMRASFRTLYVEPTDEAVARAAAARPAGLVAALILVVLVLAAAGLARRRWLGLLAVPGVLAGVALLDPQTHGAAYLLGLVGSLAAVAVVSWRASTALAARRAS
jgi:hypothetical protein